MPAAAYRFSGLLAAALLLTACGGGSGGGSGGNSGGGSGGSAACDDFDCQAMVDNLGNDVMAPTFDTFETRAGELETSAAAYADNPTATTRDAARTAWKAAMRSWQQAELMQVGPLLDNGGQLRDTIYSWPATSTCEVDQEVIEAESAGYDITTRSPRRRGLDALGYLLFRESLDHTCADVIETTAEWDARPNQERRQARADFAALAAADLADQADTLVTRWEDFVVELERPGTGDSRFDNVEQAINALSDALFYLEKQTNDTKLAAPAGFSGAGCNGAGEICLDDIESPYARVSRENLIDNMKGFRRMFLGNERGQDDAPLGFHEFLAAQSTDGENVADTMLEDLDAAQNALEGIDMSLYDAVQDPAAHADLRVAYDALSEVNKQLKDQFLRILGLTIPDAAAGDGD